MNTKPVFHGSDIEKICEYYHLNQEDIVNFGANVNPIGISTHVKQVLASHLDLLSSYPDRDYQSLRSGYRKYGKLTVRFDCCTGRRAFGTRHRKHYAWRDGVLSSVYEELYSAVYADCPAV